MKSVLLRGPILTESGYGVHARQLARWLIERNSNLTVQCLNWGDTPWIVDPSRENGLIDAIMQRTNSQQQIYDVSFQLQLPNEWDPNAGKYNVGVTAAVETDVCNPEWIAACNRMHAVVVPSTFTRDVLLKTGKVTSKLLVVPESFTDSCVNQDLVDTIDLTNEIKTNFNFLLFGQLTGNNPLNDRKNLFFTLKWICDTFKDDKDVGIVIKTNAGRMSLIDRKVCVDMFKQIVKEVRKSEFPKIYMLHGMMNDDQVASLYRSDKIKALVSATRGEGFGLPLLEAAASGLPIIATNWSGHLDFLKTGKFISVDYDLKDIHESRVDNKIFMKGSKWAEPREDDFKRKIKKLRTSYSTPKDWAQSLKKNVTSEFSFDSIKEKWEANFKDVL